MELSQRGISHRMETGFTLCLLLLSFVLSLYFAPSLFLLFLLPWLVCLLTLRIYPKNRIVVNEQGICCLGKTNTLWAFDWDEIETLTPSRRELVSNVELKVTSHRHMDILSYRQHENHLYFQLDKQARKALAQYAPSRLTEEL